MSIRVKRFISLIQSNVELLNEIAKLDAQTITDDYLRVLIGQLYPTASEESVQNKIEQLSTSKPYPILEQSEFDDEFVLASKVADLILWLSNNLHLASHRIIRALIEDINDASDSISKILEEQPINLYLLKEKMNALRRAIHELAECAVGNLRSIGTRVQEFKEEVLDFETKQIKARLLMDEHLEPMREIIDPEGPMVDALESASNRLARIETLATIPKDIRTDAKRIGQGLAINKKTVRENHWSAYSQLQPILDPYLRPASDLVKGASTALSLMNKRGVKHLNHGDSLNLIKSSKSSFVIGNEHIEMWFQRKSASKGDPPVYSFSPENQVEYVEDIPILSLVRRIVNSAPIDDILEFIMSEYTDHPLSVCNKATTDAIIEINDFYKINIGVKADYSRDSQRLEVRQISISE